MENHEKKLNRSYQKSFKEKMKDCGFVRFEVWCTEEEREALKAYLNDIREGMRL